MHTQQTFPNDPMFTQLWGLHNTGQTGGTSGADIDAPEAWDLFAGTTQVVAGVIDTGVDSTHPDLYLNIWINQAEIPAALRALLVDTNGDELITFHDLNDPAHAALVSDLNGNGYIDGYDLLNDPAWADGVDTAGNGFVDDLLGWNFVSNTNDPYDDHNHGTHVAGTIAAMGDNALGVVGVNWSAQIMALKFLSASGSGTTSGAVASVNYATMMASQFGVNLPVTNNSWGGGGYSQALMDAIESGIDAGVLFVAAAGNNNLDADVNPMYPAAYSLDGIISVAATDHNDQKAWFSNYGATSVDLGAPGVSVLSTVRHGEYTSYNGTSMAAPHVAGVATLLKGFYPDATPGLLKAAILDSADPVAALQGITVTGGRLNAAAALRTIGDPGDYYRFEVQQGDQLVSDTLVYTVQFDEPLNAAVLDPSDVALAGAWSGVHAPVRFEYSPVDWVLTLEYADLPDDLFELRLLSGPGRFEDLAGNALDGEPLAWPIPPNASGDGVPGGDFVVQFSVDFDTTPLELTDRVQPFGAQIYQDSAHGAISHAEDSDQFTVEVDAGQTLTVVVQVLLNAAAEWERYGGPANDDPASAQPLDDAFIVLGGSAQRAAVLGGSSGAIPAPDYYQFELSVGQSTTLALAAPDGGTIALELQDATGTTLALVTGASNATRSINNFVATSGGTHHVRVTGTGQYNLVVTRNADFDREPNHRLAQAQELTGTSTAQGYLADVIGDPGDYYRVEAVQGDVLTITTGTPLTGGGKPVNGLNPALQLYDPGGMLVASDEDGLDGRNARLVYAASMSGTYTVRVFSQDGDGEYVLNVLGATGDPARFEVTSSTPPAWLSLPTPPQQLMLRFNDTLLLPSLQASDLRVNGQSSPSILDIPDGRTVIFELPELSQGRHAVEIAANGGLHGRELWKSDGTAAGTIMVKDILPGSGSSNPSQLTAMDGTLFFTAQTAGEGRELWRSDGTPEGTVLVRDINGGSGSSSPLALTEVNGTVFFTAITSTAARELWKSDGTSAGTVLVKDILPGAAASVPRWLANLDGTLLFTADDGAHGVEPWTLVPGTLVATTTAVTSSANPSTYGDDVFIYRHRHRRGRNPEWNRSVHRERDQSRSAGALGRCRCPERNGFDMECRNACRHGQIRARTGFWVCRQHRSVDRWPGGNAPGPDRHRHGGQQGLRRHRPGARHPG